MLVNYKYQFFCADNKQGRHWPLAQVMVSSVNEINSRKCVWIGIQGRNFTGCFVGFNPNKQCFWVQHCQNKVFKMERGSGLEAGSYNRLVVLIALLYCPFGRVWEPFAVPAQHQSFSPTVKWHMGMRVLRKTAEVSMSGTRANLVKRKSCRPSRAP